MVRLEKRLCLKIPVSRLWPLISDTERLNRSAGLSPVKYRTEANPAGPAHLFAQTKMGPLTMSYQDFPFEWVQDDHFHVLRRFDTGPLKEMRPGVSLRSDNGATQVHISFEFLPRNLLGGWIARYLMWPALVQKYEKILRGMESFLLEKDAPDPFWKAAAKAQVDEFRMEALEQGLCKKGVPADTIRLLHEHLKNAPELDVVAMRPFALADRWGKDRTEVLRMFLHATKEGLVDLSWEILCPNCRKSKVSSGRLADLAGKAHCGYCQIQFNAEFDRSVEARFTVNPSIRKSQRAEFCAGGPANTPHILAQVLVGAGETRDVAIRAVGAPLKVRSPQIEGFSRVRVLDMAASARCILLLSDASIEPAVAEVKTGDVVFELQNKSRQERWFIIERERWDEAVATAAQVTSLQEFRDMFSSEVLAPGEEIAVRNLTFMFTDLAGSTATYHDLGDAKAYSVVREHFTVLKQAIAVHEGAVVKTIGDAVMAVFASPRQGFLAAVAMQKGIQEWNVKRNGQTPVILKIGLHEGPAIAVNTDDILDYFGTSVNLAARVESLSNGGDIVLSDDMMQAIGAAEDMAGILEKKEKLESPVKGFPRPVQAWRIRHK